MSGLSPEKQELIKAVVHEAVPHALTAMGIDAANPIESQKDMAYLRRSRKSAETTRKMVKKTVIPIAVMAVLGAVWAGAKDGIMEILNR